jgi:hypothetical protein
MISSTRPIPLLLHEARLRVDAACHAESIAWAELGTQPHPKYNQIMRWHDSRDAAFDAQAQFDIEVDLWQRELSAGT